MSTITMMAGDAFNLPIEISTENDIAGEATFEIVEVCIGNICKTTAEGEVTYDSESMVFNVPLSQEETFELHGKNPVQVRVKAANGEVIGVAAGHLIIVGSLSKAVL